MSLFKRPMPIYRNGNYFKKIVFVSIYMRIYGQTLHMTEASEANEIYMFHVMMQHFMIIWATFYL